MIPVVTVSKADKSLRGELILPSSKSISNRLLMIGALSETDFPVDGLSEAEDTLLLQSLLEAIRQQSGDSSVITLDTANAGTVMRFLTAYLAFRPGRWVLTGSDRMKRRPIGILVEALQAIGADIEYLSWLGYPPILIKGKPLSGREVTIDSGVSSQFISALLMIAPSLPNGLHLRLRGQSVSWPYIEMTLRLMKNFGIRVKRTGQRIQVPPGRYLPAAYKVESDWSAAAFWYEAAALSGDADLVLKGLDQGSLQGDSVLAEIFQNFGVNTDYRDDGIRLTSTNRKAGGFYFDFTSYPDIAPPVITTCAALGIRGRFEGLKSLRIKETDRLYAIQHEIDKMGFSMQCATFDGAMPALELNPVHPKPRSEHPIDTYGDHRMAMTFAPLALCSGAMRILNPNVVVKSYPKYWEHLKLLGFEVR